MEFTQGVILLQSTILQISFPGNTRMETIRVKRQIEINLNGKRAFTVGLTVSKASQGKDRDPELTEV